MRHDWTLLCNEAQVHDSGNLDLGNVFASLHISDPYGLFTRVDTVVLDPPIILVSHWTVEFYTDRRIHNAIVQLLAPDGERILWSDRLAFDLRHETTFRMVYIIQNLKFVGIGTYEFHVLLEENGVVNEWGRACLYVS